MAHRSQRPSVLSAKLAGGPHTVVPGTMSGQRIARSSSIHELKIENAELRRQAIDLTLEIRKLRANAARPEHTLATA